MPNKGIEREMDSGRTEKVAEPEGQYFANLP